MKEATEYQIFIGCRDSELHDEVVSEDELRETVTQFFRQREIGFSMLSAKGGYLHTDGRFIYENTLLINIIGSNDFDILRLSRGLSMYMNQECTLVIKDIVKTDYR